MQDGHKLILWSVREGELLDEAVKWCEQRGVRFYAVNADLDEDANSQPGKGNYSRKLKAHIFIDDRNLGGLPDWGTIYQLVSKRISYDQYLKMKAEEQQPMPKKKPWWKI